jgi:hypothetical protein
VVLGLPILRGRLAGAKTRLPLTVGFVWSDSTTAPTLQVNTGASVPTQVTGDAATGLVDFSYQTTSVAAGTYYVRAYVVWPAADGQPVTYSRATTASTFTVTETTAQPSTTLLGLTGSETLSIDLLGVLDLHGVPLDTVQEVGFLWGTSPVGLTRESCFGYDDTSPPNSAPYTFESTISAVITSGRMPLGRYYVNSFLTQEDGTYLYGIRPYPFYVGPPVVPTVAMVDVQNSGASVVRFNGVLDLHGLPTDLLLVGFMWGLTSSFTRATCINYTVSPPGGDLDFTYAISSVDLEPGSYFVNALVQPLAVSGTAYGYGPVALPFVVGLPPLTVSLDGVSGSGTLEVMFEGALTLSEGWLIDSVTVGFVWGSSNENLTFDNCLGSVLQVTNVQTFQFTITDEELGLGSYYVNAVVRYEVDGEVQYGYGEAPAAFEIADPDPPPILLTTTMRAYQTIGIAGGYNVNMQLEIGVPESVPETTSFGFLVSDTNPEPTFGGEHVTSVVATRSGLGFLADTTYFTFNVAYVKYVRAFGTPLGGPNILADNVLTVQRAPLVLNSLSDVSPSNVTFKGAAYYSPYPPPGDGFSRVTVVNFGYIWTLGAESVPTLSDGGFLGLSQQLAPDEQSSTYVPAFDPYTVDFAASGYGPGSYNCCTFVQFQTNNGTAVVYSFAINTIIPFD